MSRFALSTHIILTVYYAVLVSLFLLYFVLLPGFNNEGLAVFIAIPAMMALAILGMGLYPGLFIAVFVYAVLLVKINSQDDEFKQLVDSDSLFRKKIVLYTSLCFSVFFTLSMIALIYISYFEPELNDLLTEVIQKKLGT